METFWEIVLRFFLMLPLITTLVFICIDIYLTEKQLKAAKKVHAEIEKLVDKKCKEIEDGIGKELAETKKENERLKKLCDRTLAVAEEQDKKIEQLQRENEQLKEKSKVKQSKK